MPRTEMTKRLLAALHNEQVDILGHPTGRIIQEREPVQADLPVIFDAAAGQGVSLEINAAPSRLDLSDTNCRMAREHGARFSIGTDAKAKEDLGFMELGIATARRGWLERKDIINTLHLRDLLDCSNHETPYPSTRPVPWSDQVRAAYLSLNILHSEFLSTMTEFQLTSTFAPEGSQPVAIRQLTEGLFNNEQFQTLLGVTGSGKTFTMANVIAAREQANAGARP